MKTLNSNIISIALKRDEMLEIQGGSFCHGVYVVDGAYTIGVLANWWNPIGWGGTVALLAVNGYCAFK